MARDELTAWVCAMDQYKAQKGADRQFYLSAWSGVNITIDRKGKAAQGPIIVPSPFLSVVGGLTPDMLDTLTDDRGREDGFLHRVLFAYPDAHAPESWTDDSISKGALVAWREVLNFLWKLKLKASIAGSGSVQVKMTAPAREVWVERYNAHLAELGDKGFPYNLRGPWVKLTSDAPRFGLILQLSRVACRVSEKEDLAVPAAERAWLLVDYFKSHARKVYQQLAVSPQEKADNGALNWIRKQGGKTTAREVLRNHVTNVKNAGEAKALLVRLHSRGFGSIQEKGARVVFALKE